MKGPLGPLFSNSTFFPRELSTQIFWSTGECCFYGRASKDERRWINPRPRISSVGCPLDTCVCESNRQDSNNRCSQHRERQAAPFDR